MIQRLYKIVVSLFICQCIAFAPLAYADQLPLPTGDLTPPQVTHDIITEPVHSGSPLTINATVKDSGGVQWVVVYFRTKNSSDEFQRLPMQKEPGSDIYSAAIMHAEKPGIEYYLQASDLAGNVLLHGHSFAPLTISVDDAPPVAADAPQPTTMPEARDESASTVESAMTSATEASAKSSYKWLWIGLGVVATAAILSKGKDREEPIGKPGETATLDITAPAPSQ